MTEEDRLIVLGGPLFRKLDITREEFGKAWHRHAEVVSPWFLEFGVTEYTQIHLHLPSTSASVANNPKQQQVSEPDVARACEILRQAEGVAFVKCHPVRKSSGVERPFGDGFEHRYFLNVIAEDERTFLHSESGASAVKGNPIVLPELPEIAGGATTWRRIALEIGGQEYVKIRDAKAVVDNVWWEEWKNLAGA